MIMFDPPSPRTIKESIEIRALTQHFEKLLREQADQFQQ